MFEASVDGRPYDVDKWGAYYRPYGIQAPASASQETAKPAESVATPAPAPAAPAPVAEAAPEATPAPVAEAASTDTSSDKAQDILAMIRARQNNS